MSPSPSDSRTKRSGRRRNPSAVSSQRVVDYRNLKNPFPTMSLFSDDRIEAMHHAALELLEADGIKVLLAEARQIYKQAGARVDEGSQMVYLGRELIEQALSTAPKQILCKAGHPSRDLTLELGRLCFQPGAGAPHATDCERGRRPGSADDFAELVKICQHFDVLHMMPPIIEPQDIAPHLRHYFTMQTQLYASDKLPHIFSRGRAQILDGFEMLKTARGLSDDEFTASSHCYSIINTNSPRVLDSAMAEGLIDCARFGQMTVVTPFTLMGAMAPITVAGALTLSHAEALAAITLTQLTSAGAPVCYGTFTSNVDMKSGAPAFGTPEHFKASIVAGQLARLIGLPWRNATGSAANINDVQAAQETQFGLWGTLLSGSTMIIHAAGWLEGGLTVSYEKLITDLELLQMTAELCAHTPSDDDAIGLDAIREVGTGGHFFAAGHTMDRYQTAFYEPVISDWSNFGSWTEKGSRTATQRATDIWKQIISEEQDCFLAAGFYDEVESFVRRRSAEGGAPPLS